MQRSCRPHSSTLLRLALAYPKAARYLLLEGPAATTTCTAALLEGPAATFAAAACIPPLGRGGRGRRGGSFDGSDGGGIGRGFIMLTPVIVKVDGLIDP